MSHVKKSEGKYKIKHYVQKAKIVSEKSQGILFGTDKKCSSHSNGKESNKDKRNLSRLLRMFLVFFAPLS